MPTFVWGNLSANLAKNIILFWSPILAIFRIKGDKDQYS